MATTIPMTTAVPTEVDVIIIGGGAAGCIVASRLAAADPTLEILVIEAGHNNLEDPDVIKPSMCIKNLTPASSKMKAYTGLHSEHLGGRSSVVTVAQVLGGGSSVNYLMYTRACASDYDDWNTDGWSAQDLLPLFRKCETFNLKTNSPETHGSSGPLGISYGGYQLPITDELLKTAQDKGLVVTDDAQDLKTVNAFARWPKWIDPVTKRRSDTAHCYLHPQMAKNSNLHLLVESTVSKIIIEGGKATGVEYVPTVAAEGTAPPRHTVKARKLVVLSAGSISSPRVLERSGVGAKAILEAVGITPIVDLPGVGSNYQDHLLCSSWYQVTDDTETPDDLFRLDPSALLKAEEGWPKGEGALTSNFMDVGSKIRPTDAEVASLGPDFQKYWKEKFENAKDKAAVLTCWAMGYVGPHKLFGLEEGKYIGAVSIMLYPAGRGFVHITSTDPYEHPSFDPGFLSHPADLAPLMWSYKFSRELARRMPSYRGEVPLLHPEYPAGSAAAAKAVNSEDIATKTDLVYTEEDDKAIENHIRKYVGSTWHGLGTLAMKPREDGGVVDKDLNVYGVANLKVADMSICPTNVGANTYSTAVVVGEKAAIICATYLGIPNV